MFPQFPTQKNPAFSSVSTQVRKLQAKTRLKSKESDQERTKKADGIRLPKCQKPITYSEINLGVKETPLPHAPRVAFQHEIYFISELSSKAAKIFCTSYLIQKADEDEEKAPTSIQTSLMCSCSSTLPCVISHIHPCRAMQSLPSPQARRSNTCKAPPAI